MWNNNEVQFARLIVEAKMAGALTKPVLKDMTESMDLSEKELEVIINRAETTFRSAVDKAWVSE